MGFISISVFLWILFIYFICESVQNIIGEQIYGVFVGQDEQWEESKVYYPIIEYQLQGVTQQFQSTIYAYKPFIIGTQLQLVRHARSGAIERRDVGRLFMGGIMILLMALAWTAVTIDLVFYDGITDLLNS